jgi:hypothetical protein
MWRNMVIAMLDREKLHEEMKARQQNVVWPGPTRNARFFYDFLWNGSQNATPVLRIGAFLLGLVYLVSGWTMFYYSFLDGSFLGVLISFGFLWLGVRVLYKALRKPAPKSQRPRRV